jgi:hypothetical protein
MVIRILRIAIPLLIVFVIFCSKKNNLAVIQKQDILRGTVISGMTFEPLTDAKIQFKNIDVKTDSNGYFEIEVPDGEVDLTKDAISFQRFPYKIKNININDFLKNANLDTIILELPPKLAKYQALIAASINQGYKIVPVIEWYRDLANLQSQKVIIMRHDVDFDPKAAMALGYIENQFHARSTFYFRWSTVDSPQVNYLKNFKDEIGLHYETLATYCTKKKITEKSQVTKQVFDTCRETLKEEILLFESRYGDIFSICSHGAARNTLIGISNSALVSKQKMADYYVDIEANSPEITKPVSIMISDSGNKWAPISYEDALKQNYQIIYILIHPDWWGDMKITRNMN